MVAVRDAVACAREETMLCTRCSARVLEMMKKMRNILRVRKDKRKSKILSTISGHMRIATSVSICKQDKKENETKDAARR